MVYVVIECKLMFCLRSVYVRFCLEAELTVKCDYSVSGLWLLVAIEYNNGQKWVKNPRHEYLSQHGSKASLLVWLTRAISMDQDDLHH